MRDLRALLVGIVDARLASHALEHGIGIDDQVVILPVEEVGGERAQAPEQAASLHIACDYGKVGELATPCRLSRRMKGDSGIMASRPGNSSGRVCCLINDRMAAFAKG